MLPQSYGRVEQLQQLRAINNGQPFQDSSPVWGVKSLKFQAVCPQNGTAVLKGSKMVYKKKRHCNNNAITAAPMLSWFRQLRGITNKKIGFVTTYGAIKIDQNPRRKQHTYHPSMFTKIIRFWLLLRRTIFNGT